MFWSEITQFLVRLTHLVTSLCEHATLDNSLEGHKINVRIYYSASKLHNLRSNVS